jgi:hypothetical protein
LLSAVMLNVKNNTFILSVTMLNVIMLSVTLIIIVEGCCAEWQVLFILELNVIMRVSL